MGKKDTVWSNGNKNEQNGVEAKTKNGLYNGQTD
jgi:hypothetical protein